MKNTTIIAMILLIGLGTKSANAQTAFVNPTLAADLLTAANWDNGLPTVANPGVIGSTGDGGGVYNASTGARNFLNGRSISIYGSSALTYINSSSWNSSSADQVLNLFDNSLLTVNNANPLNATTIGNLLGTINVYNNAQMTKFGDISGTGTINIFDNGYVETHKPTLALINLHGGTLSLMDNTSTAASIGQNGTSAWINFSLGSTAQIFHSGADWTTTFQSALDTDRIRINNAVNLDGDYSAWSIDYDGQNNITRLTLAVPEPTVGVLSVGGMLWLLLGRRKMC